MPAALRDKSAAQAAREAVLGKLCHDRLPDVWVKKDGTIIRIKDMDDTHVSNALRCSIVAASVQRARMVVFYVTCEEPIGMHAQDGFDMELDSALGSTWGRYADRFFDALLEEARRRGLSGSAEAEIAHFGAGVDLHTRRMEDDWIDRIEIAKLEGEIGDKKAELKELTAKRKRAVKRREAFDGRK